MEKYTTTDLLTADPTGEKDKIIISTDFYALCDFLEQNKKALNTLNNLIARSK